jgi:putative tricarboxylic transport membrane protein
MSVKGSFARSSILGILIGIVPGAGATIASFLSYGVEAQYGRRRKEMGTGIAEGIVAPQSAATASVGGAMIPLLTMGIPGSGATAIILGAFMLQGVQPGPQVFVSQPELIYAIFASVFVSLIGMCLLGYFAIKALVKVLDFPEAAVSSFVVMFCFIGALAARNNINDSVDHRGVRRRRLPVREVPLPDRSDGARHDLGPLAENYFLTAMISAEGNWTTFFTRPVSAVLMLFSAVTLLYPTYRNWRDGRA